MMRPTLAVAVAGASIAAVCAFVDARALLHGVAIWLIGASAVCCGSVAWLAIHALTGGRWGEAAHAPLLRMALLTPLVAIPALVLVFFGSVYPWMADAPAMPQDVLHLYLNGPSVALRTATVLAGLWSFAVAVRRAPLGRGAASLCLIVYAIGMNMFAVDFVASIDPRYTSSAVGVELIFLQLAASLGAALVTSPGAHKAVADLGALLLACLLGESYVLYMTYLIHWYGNQPATVHYYLVRSTGHWHTFDTATAVLWIATMLLLMLGRVRRTPALSRAVAAAALVCVALVAIWLVAPAAGDMTAAGGLAALAGGACLVASGALAMRICEAAAFGKPTEVEHV